MDTLDREDDALYPMRIRTASLSAQERPMIHSGKRAIYTAGRPPWYDSHGQLKEAFIIGICGGSASGKTTIAEKIIEAIDVQWVSFLSMDSFYRVDYTEEEQVLIKGGDYNFDHPDAFDFDLIEATLLRLKEGKSVEVPVYNFITCSREKLWNTIYGANVVIFEGILSFYSKNLLDIFDMKVFVDVDSDLGLARRLKRDIAERGRDIEVVLKQYDTFVKPSFEHYIEPCKRYADIIVPGGKKNVIAMAIIVNYTHQQLVKRGHQFRNQLRHAHTGQPLPKSLIILEATSQVRRLHTVIRNKETSRDEFIFYSKCLMRLLIEHSLSLLPHINVTVDTPQGVPYDGLRMNAKKLIGVSVLRAGECLEKALIDVVQDISIGKILIQTNLSTGEPELHYLTLPRDIKDKYVLLMEGTIATGAAAMMAIRVLLDHDVPEENIILLSVLMAETGVHSIAYAFPKVRLMTTAVDKDINDEFHILPGIGKFGDRFFGTSDEKRDGSL